MNIELIQLSRSIDLEGQEVFTTVVVRLPSGVELQLYADAHVYEAVLEGTQLAATQPQPQQQTEADPQPDPQPWSPSLEKAAAEEFNPFIEPAVEPAPEEQHQQSEDANEFTDEDEEPVHWAYLPENILSDELKQELHRLGVPSPMHKAPLLEYIKTVAGRIKDQAQDAVNQELAARGSEEDGYEDDGVRSL